MRKVLSVLLAAALMLSVLGVTAFAADVEYPIGATAITSNGVTVLTLTANEDTVSGSVSVDFDSSVLTCTAANVSGTLDSVAVTEGNVTFGYASETANAIAAGETIAVIKFEGSVEGYTALDVTIVDFNDQSGIQKMLPSVAIPEGALRFLDVPSDKWYYDAVEYTAQRGYFNGVGEQLFDPCGAMSRAMFVTVLGRMAGVQPWEYGTTAFTDVNPEAYYAGYVAWALEAGVTKGVSETEFDPHAPASRQQAATFMYRYAQWCGMDVTVDDTKLEAFDDVNNVSAYAWDAMAWVTENGIFIGSSSNQLMPRDSTTRAQGAAIIQRLDILLG